VKAIARASWDVFTLRGGPQAFPREWAPFTLVVAVYLVSDAVSFLAQGLGATAIAEETTFDFGLQVLYFVLVLAAKFNLPRLRQSLAAWFGAGVILNLLATPVNLGAFLSKADWAQEFWFVLTCLLIAWSMAVMAQVLRYALEIGLAFSLIVAAVYTFASTVVFIGLFPG